MAMKKTLGGDRLGSGKKMQVELHGYERSTHDLGYLWRSTMSPGTLVPFLCEVALPGDTFDINLDCDIKTHPTIGPLFGSYKVQLDIFQAPIRLYIAALHNNKLGIGMDMASVKLPIMTITAKDITPLADISDIDNCQVNPSCILNYLGIKGIGATSIDIPRTFNGLPLLTYWDIYKNYYANKQEEIGAVIHSPQAALVQTIDSITNQVPQTIPQSPLSGAVSLSASGQIIINYTGAVPIPSQVIITFQNTGLGDVRLDQLCTSFTNDTGTTTLTGEYDYSRWGQQWARNWRYRNATDLEPTPPQVVEFPLENIDHARELILQAPTNVAFDIGGIGEGPYDNLFSSSGGIPNIMNNQEGLGLKTYQSDLFNNWMNTEWIDGPNGINEITAIDTSGGSFTQDTLNLSKKVYDMLNRIAISGGTYDDWQDAVWDHHRYTRCETPMYMGGLSKELIFQEVVSNAEATSENGAQPLGTLAGKGIMGKKHKGGRITIKVDEPSYIMGIISLTPRIDYSQGNKWDTHLLTMDDLHKPALDEIGFQELITEQMAWWDTSWDIAESEWVTHSAGKQPAWINYMTNVNRVYGNFAIATNEMFMTLNRQYEMDTATGRIKDLTTYIDPVKYNNIFANTAITAENFWTQIAVDITARRKMSAKVMPNL